VNSIRLFQNRELTNPKTDVRVLKKKEN